MEGNCYLRGDGELGAFLERFGFVGQFPGEGCFRAAEVAVERRSCDTPAGAASGCSIMPFGVSLKVLANQLHQALLLPPCRFRTYPP